MKMHEGVTIPASAAKHSVIEDLIQENILFRTGRIRKTIGLIDPKKLELYLHNRFSIKDLTIYVSVIEKSEFSRASVVDITGDSKLKRVRTFKGFLINCFSPIPAVLNSEEILLEPRDGIFHFIYDYESFVPAPDVTIVGVENSENFRRLREQAYLFRHIRPLFVSRYPQNQSKDFITWMKSVPNDYLHFGDFDLAGIGIYLNEYKHYFPEKSRFFVPEGLEEILKNSGSRKRYNSQKAYFDEKAFEEEELLNLVKLIHKHKKGLDQERFIETVTN